MFDDYNEYNDFCQDDLEMYNQNEADDYRNEGREDDWYDDDDLDDDGDWDDDDYDDDDLDADFPYGDDTEF